MKKILMIGATIAAMTTGANASEFISACAKADMWKGHFDMVQKGITDLHDANQPIPDSLKQIFINIVKELDEQMVACLEAREKGK
jgi:hypothetical protein